MADLFYAGQSDYIQQLNRMYSATKGDPGTAWYYGTVDPTSGTGVNGDFYLNTTSGDIFSKTTGTWYFIANLGADASAEAAAAAASATAAQGYAATATTQATNAANSATAAGTQATAASTQATNAANSATASANSATTSGTQATNSANSATAAAASASAASTLATNSANSATAAATSATNASASADRAEAAAAGAAASITIKDEGTTLTTAVSSLNFTGSGVTATNSGSVVTVSITGGSGGSITVQDEGTTLTTAATLLNFVGGEVTATNTGGNVTITIPTVTTTTLGIPNVENKSSSTIRGEITSGNVTTALGYTPVNPSIIGAASGIVPLNSSSKIASTYMPDTGSVAEGTNKYFTESRVLASIIAGLSTATNAVITASDSVLGALGKLQKQISDNLSTLTTHTGSTSNPHSVTKAQVGLGSVDNTADTAKPVSTAQQTALDLKANLAGPTFTGTTTLVGIKETKTSMGANDISQALSTYFSKTISGATTLTVSNVAASGTVSSFILDLTNGGSAVITWWSGMKWAGGTAPTLTTSGRDVLGFFTTDGGTTWTGLLLAKDVK